MAFWGVVVKPGKPVTHSCEKVHGRLRITQAMLGIGEATQKTIVQCNVGKRIPMLLCALFPGRKESCRLELEFAEADDVVFSVIGPRSVYLTGYYVAETRFSGPQSDSESFGVDIQNSHSEESSHHSDDDDYEDSFIDDDELEVLPPSPLSSNQYESDLEDDKQKAKKNSRRHLRKSSRAVVSDSESDSHGNEDEDGYLLSVFKNKCSEKKTSLKVEEANTQATAESSDNESDSHENDDEDGYLLSVFKNKSSVKKTMSKDQEKKDQETVDKGDDHANKLKEEAGPHVASGTDERGLELLQYNKVTRSKNKKKKVPKEAKILTETTVSKEKVLSDGNIQENVEEPNSINQNVPTSDMNIQIDNKQKRKRKDRPVKEEKTCEVDVDMDHSAVKEGKEHAVEATSNMDSNSGRKSKKRRKEPQVEVTSTEGIVGTGYLSSCYKPEGLSDIDGKMNVLPEASGLSVEEKTNNESGKKKKKRSKKKTQDENPFTTDISAKRRTLSNGLSIEVLSNGLPDGKVAAHGKKVKIHYTATVKETGHIIDSSVGKTALKFRLGDKEFTDEWNAGIDGMHVGEKRRFVVPPSLGFMKQENVPPNSWLVYDVELVDMH